jgi:putative ABC transport system permease protein
VIAAQTLKIALRGLLANRMRSILTMLGILIGVASVIVLVAVGNGSKVAVAESIEKLGSNTLTISAGGGFGPSSRNATQSSANALGQRDVTALADRELAPDIKTVSPVVTASSVTAASNGSTTSITSFIGSTPSYFAASAYAVGSGAFFTQAQYDAHAKVAVIGPTVATALGMSNPVGQKIQFNNASFEVIGVYRSKGSTGGFQDADAAVIAPLPSVRDALAGNSGTYSSIVVQARDAAGMDAAQSEITTILMGVHRVTDSASLGFSVLNQSSLLEASTSTSRTLTVLLGAVAAISLLVGGIGVMNIMLVTVTERTREIGIRKAIGATRSDILSQFLAESVLLSMLGGVLGVAVGLIGSTFKIVGIVPVVQTYSIVLAFGVAIAVGLFFGIYPANRAAALRPIDALRYE